MFVARREKGITTTRSDRSPPSSCLRANPVLNQSAKTQGETTMTLMKKIRGSRPVWSAMAIVLLMTACGVRQSWREVESFGNAKAGTLLRLQPLSAETLKVSPDREFRFHCTSAIARGEVEYRTSVGIVWVGAGSRRTSDTTDSKPQQWSPQKSDVVFQYHAIPFLDPIGKARMYFYLVDKDGRCISNIIEWQAVFVPSAN
jgi:hypothetical protein